MPTHRTPRELAAYHAAMVLAEAAGQAIARLGNTAVSRRLCPLETEIQEILTTAERIARPALDIAGEQ